MNCQEILEVSLIICAQDWKLGLKPLLPYLEEAFIKVSLVKRVEYLIKLLRIPKTDMQSQILKIPKLCIFAEWMSDAYRAELADLEPVLRKYLPCKDPSKERETMKLEFISRLKPIKVESALIEQVENKGTTGTFEIAETDQNTKKKGRENEGFINKDLERLVSELKGGSLKKVGPKIILDNEDELSSSDDEDAEIKSDS